MFVESITHILGTITYYDEEQENSIMIVEDYSLSLKLCFNVIEDCYYREKLQ